MLASAEEVRKIVGARGQVRAQMSALVEEAEAIADQATLAVARVREELDGLLSQVGDLVGQSVVSQRLKAEQATEAVARYLPEVEKTVRSFRVALSAETVHRRLPELRRLTDTIRQEVETARMEIAVTWEAAEAELVEARRQRAASRAIHAATETAIAHAQASRRLVDEARTVLEESDSILSGTRQEESHRLRQRAVEIIGIAEFQAGEAEAAADQAARETEASEARAQAQTALSFFERISADLPDALDALERAQQLADNEVTTLDRAREETASTHATVSHLAATARKAATIGRTEAADWFHLPAVSEGLHDLEETIGGFSQDLEDVSWAVREVLDLVDLEVAVSVLNAVGTVSDRARERRRKVDSILEQVAKAIKEQRADDQARTDARATVDQAIDAVLANLERIQAASTRLNEQANAHQAEGDEVDAAQSQMEAAIQNVEQAASELSGLAGRVAQAEDGVSAKMIAQKSLAFRRAAEAAIEAAADAETRGIAAAEAESRARQIALERALERAREEVKAASGRMTQLVSRMEETFQRARAEGLDAIEQSTLAVSQAHQTFIEASTLNETVHEIARAIDDLVARAAEAQTTQDADAIVNEARVKADEAVTLFSQVQEALDSAVDLARNELAEVEAIHKVRGEISALLPVAQAAADNSNAAAQRILSVLGDADATRPEGVDDARTRELESTVRASVAKAEEAVDLIRVSGTTAEAAGSLRSAQAILEQVRNAISDAMLAGEQMADLLEAANDELLAAQLVAAEALEAARKLSAEPAQEAAAASKKADAWLEAGRREAREANLEDQLDYELTTLARAVRIVARHAGSAEEAAQRGAAANLPTEAEAAAEPAARSSREALRSAEEARKALDRVRNRIKDLTATAAAVANVVQESSERRQMAAQMADQAEATLQGLEGRVAKMPAAPRSVASAVEHVRAAATRARLAAGRANSGINRARTAKTQAEAMMGGQEVKTGTRRSHGRT